MTIAHLSELQAGDRLLIHSTQFARADGLPNPGVFVSHDRTPLKRKIAYVCFDRGIGKEPEFAIWQSELDAGQIVLERATKRAQFQPAFARCLSGRLLIAYWDSEGCSREAWVTCSLADAVEKMQALMEPGEHQPQGATLIAPTAFGMEEVLVMIGSRFLADKNAKINA